MTRRVLLREVAHARAGDKGNRSNVAVYAYEQRHYAALAAQLTPERLRAEFPQLLRGRVQRFELARSIVAERMLGLHGCNAPLRLDLIGVSALHATARPQAPGDARDVRLRAALRAGSREQAELLLWEVESLLCCGPAGGGGYRGQITPSVITHSAWLPRDQVPSRIEIIET